MNKLSSKIIFTIAAIVIVVVFLVFMQFQIFEESETAVVSDINSEKIVNINNNRTKLDLAGLYSTSDRTAEDGQYITDHYFERINGEREKRFESMNKHAKSGSIREGKFVYVRSDEEAITFYLGDLLAGIEQEVMSLPTMGFNDYISGIALSQSAETLYFSRHWDHEDYDLQWNDADFSMSEIRKTVEIYSYNILTYQLEKIYSAESNLEVYNVLNVTDKYIILSDHLMETDNQEMVFLNLQNGSIDKSLFNQSIFEYDISADGRYLAYVDLLSKGGDFDPAQIRVIDLRDLSDVTPLFISQLDFGVRGGLDTQYSWWNLMWSIDNSKLYLSKGDYMDSDVVSVLYSLDLNEKTFGQVDFDFSVYNSPSVEKVIGSDIYFSDYDIGTSVVEYYGNDELLFTGDVFDGNDMVFIEKS